MGHELIKKLVGKTIYSADFNEDEATCVLHFTDGTKYELKAEAVHADEYWLSLEQLTDGVALPNAHYLKHVDLGYFVEGREFSQDRSKAKEMTIREATSKMGILVDGTMDIRFIEEKFRIVNKFEDA